MIQVCKKCGRSHSGVVCGIPPRSTMRNPGLAVRLSLEGRGIHRAILTQAGTPSKVGGYNKVAERKKGIKKQIKQETLLETLLGLNREWQAKVKGLLKQVPNEIPEYSQLQERLEKLMESEVVLLRQLAMRK